MKTNSVVAVLVSALALAGCAADADLVSSEPAVIGPAPADQATVPDEHELFLPTPQKLPLDKRLEETVRPDAKIPDCPNPEQVLCECGICAMRTACISLCGHDPRY